MEVDYLPKTRPPKPVRGPLLSPEINVQLNVTPEKKGFREPYLTQEVPPKSFESNAGSCNAMFAQENILSQPQMNTTAIITRKLEELSETKFDAPTSIRQELKKSEKLRQDIAEKASEALNYNSKEAIYPGLVSLDVSVSDLALQQRRIFREKKTSESGDEPDIMSFMSNDLEYESVSLSCDCKSASTELELGVVTQPNEDVFRLYNLMECWKR